jgi:hypothetical protein
MAKIHPESLRSGQRNHGVSTLWLMLAESMSLMEHLCFDLVSELPHTLCLGMTFFGKPLHTLR